MKRIYLNKTPVVFSDYISKITPCQVDIKGDHLIHPVISGNKFRKLKYTLPEAISQYKKHIVSFGGAFSNHLPALAFACREAGLLCTGIVRGDELNENSNQVLKFCKEQGMNLHFVSRERYREKHILFEEYTQGNPIYFFVDEGGYSHSAMLGCADMIDELDTEYDAIFCASGTGATAAGFAFGCHRRNWKTQVHAIAVLKDADFLQHQIGQLIPELNNYTLHTEFHTGGYAKTNPEYINFLNEIAPAIPVEIEPVYTGKMFYAVYKLAQRNVFTPQSKILLVHTGGLLYKQLT